MTNLSSKNKVLISPDWKKNKKLQEVGVDLPAKASDKNENIFCCLLRVGITQCIFLLRQSPGGEIACAPLRQYSGGEVGVCQSPRRYTQMESDSCQEGSGLPCPLHRKSRQKRSARRQAACVYCLMALPLYRTETHRPG